MSFEYHGDPCDSMDRICESCGARYGSHSGDTCPEVGYGDLAHRYIATSEGMHRAFFARDIYEAYNILYRLVSRDPRVQEHRWLYRFAWDLRQED